MLFQISGVAQGSILSLLLFDKFINDIGRSILDCENFQSYLIPLNHWYNTNTSPFNITNCNVMPFIIMFDCRYIDSILEMLDNIKDLAINSSFQLNFLQHIHSSLANVYRSLGFILRNSKNFRNILHIPRYQKEFNEDY